MPRNLDEVRVHRGAKNATQRASNVLPSRGSPSGYYEWRVRPRSPRSIANETLRDHIVRVHRESRRTYGRPRIHAELSAQGIAVGANRVGRLMKSAGIEGIRPRRFRKTTDSSHTLPIAANS